jgi:D-beta-D-heptose 7-phosphate kinase/D-beta-D-heptose 1-phosphate adenosyltransferase
MRIIVYGEIILDKYFISTTNRKAPECDIPIYLNKSIENKLGGASNVALNLNNFCDLEFVSVLGNDEYKNEIINLLNNNGIKHKLFVSDRKCIVKNRTICNNQIVHRLDIEDSFDISDDLINNILLYFEKKFKTEKFDGLILSDYNKGIIPFKMSQKIIELCNSFGIKTFVDPKVKDFNKYLNCTFFKPNFDEACGILNLDISNKHSIIDEKILCELYKKVNCNYLMITKGSEGLIGYNGLSFTHIKHNKTIDVVDVTGAGDIIISVFTFIFLLTNDFEFSCKISNCVGGVSVQHLGNYRFTNTDIIKSNSCIYSTDVSIIKNLRKLHKNIVFTNGCFDIIHTGHLKLLKYCKSQGDILVLGLNTDNSIKRFKGETRPINKQSDRVEFIQLLDIADYIIIFDENDPTNILKNLLPDIMVKGSDYNIDNIIGKEYAKKVLFFDLVPEKSTTNIIKKINSK